MNTQTVTSHRKLSGSFKSPGAVYSVWLFGVSESSSTSWNRLRNFGVPADRDCLPCEASESDNPWQLVSTCATASCWGPSCHDNTRKCRTPAARPPATLPLPRVYMEAMTDPINSNHKFKKVSTESASMMTLSLCNTESTPNATGNYNSVAKKQKTKTKTKQNKNKNRRAVTTLQHVLFSILSL